VADAEDVPSSMLLQIFLLILSSEVVLAVAVVGVDD